MAVLNKTAAALDDVRNVVAQLETHIAEVRRASGHFDPDALRAQALSEMTLDGLELTLQHIEKSQEVIATSHALLKEIEENERYWASQADQSNKLTLPAAAISHVPTLLAR